MEQNIRMVLENIIHRMALYREPLKAPDHTIHQSRKSIKRIRAILKMIRDEAGYSFYFRENRFFRDLSRQLSPARDLSVQVQTLELLEKNCPEEMEAPEVMHLREHLCSLKEDHFERLTGPGGRLSTYKGELDRAVFRINNTLYMRDDFVSIENGISKTYRRARQYLKEIHGDLSNEVFHEYRKYCRYVQYQIELIQPLFPAVLKGYASALDDYSKRLGKIRDLQRFEIYLQQELPDLIADSTRENILHAVEKLGLKYKEGVYKNGGRIFAEKPRNFMDRIHRYWNVQ
ncbi:MAG: CHAD domain-containing protein [bacterium]